MPYDLFQHRHNFSVWAAARASQRGFTTVDKHRDALEQCGLVEYIRDHVSCEMDQASFAKRHREWCESIVNFLEDAGIQKVTFGRAAKLVAIYIKSMVVVGPHSNTSFARVAHPPIDRILLQKLARISKLPRKARKTFRTTNWTHLDRNHYYALIKDIRKSVRKLDPFWRLERYWTVTQSIDY